MKPEDRTSDYVCIDCGVKYLTEDQKKDDRITTVSDSDCGLCGEHKPTKHIRHYNYLRK